MSKLLNDEKVVALVTKSSAAAAKAETKRVLAIVKDHGTAAKDLEDKAAKKAVAEALKNIVADIKAAA